MAISITSFSPNTTILSSAVNTNFTNLKTEVDDLRAEKTLSTASDAATVTFNLETSHVFTVTLGGNRTLALSNATVGEAFVILLKQDGTGGRTVTWFSGISWASGVTPVLTTTASKTDIFGFICTAAGIYAGCIVGTDI